MTTLMQHPKHGRHPACGHEIDGMKANGWTFCPPKVKEGAQEVTVIASAVEAVIDAPAPVPEAPAPRRRGPNKRKG